MPPRGADKALYTTRIHSKRMSLAGAPDAAPSARGQPGGDAGGTGPTATTGGPDSITVVVNRKEYEAPAPDMTPEEIKKMADAPLHHMLILAAGAPDGGGDEPKPDGSGPIHLERGMRFRTVNRAEFGCEAQGRRPPPPAMRPRPATKKRCLR